MTDTTIRDLTARQRRFFDTGVTLDIRYRTAALKRLQKVLLDNRGELNAALRHDLGKPDPEIELFEIGPVLTQLRWLIRHLPRLCSGSGRRSAPYGVTLILGSWCAPLLLTLGPLAAALAAGNTVILKPSSRTPETSRLLARLIGQIFPAAYVQVLEGAREAYPGLLEERFDHMFLTGTAETALLARQQAGLTPVTAETGGKSPCIVHRSADLPDAARKVVFGKFLGCGQSAAAPDYVLCDEAVREEFLRLLEKEIRRQYGREYRYNLAYGRIVSRQHFDRLTGLLDPAQVFLGGGHDAASLRIEPTVLTGVGWSDPVMAQELLGPILPVLSFRDASELPELLREASPALYLFARDKEVIRTVTGRCRFRACCLGDAVLPPPSGQRGFDTFSRSVPLGRCFGPGHPLRYQPYTGRSVKLVGKIFR